MSSKKTFMLRLDPAVYAALEKWAADEFRSVNGQLEWLIDRALSEHGRTKKTLSQNPKTDVHLPQTDKPETKQTRQKD